MQAKKMYEGNSDNREARKCDFDQTFSIFRALWRSCRHLTQQGQINMIIALTPGWSLNRVYIALRCMVYIALRSVAACEDNYSPWQLQCLLSSLITPTQYALIMEPGGVITHVSLRCFSTNDQTPKGWLSYSVSKYWARRLIDCVCLSVCLSVCCL